MSSLLHLIQRTDWQFFVTCTFANSRTMGAKTRHAMQFQMLRFMASFGKKERRGDVLRDLKFVLREELGDQTGRLHWHALVSGLKPSFVRSSTCLISMGYWMGMGGGMTRIRVYDDAQDGSSYVTKGLEGVEWNSEGANSYETGKFREDSTLMLIPSHALLAEWRHMARESGRLTRQAQDRRRTARCDIINHTLVSSSGGAEIDNDDIMGELFPSQQWVKIQG